MANVITTVLNLDATKLRTGLKGAQASIQETDGFINKAKAGWSAAFASFASSPVAIGAATAAVGAFAASSISAASDLEESINAVNVTFGESADKILEFGETAARSVGLAKAEFNELATPLGAILKNAGTPLDEVADKTIVLTQRAADMASVFNTDVSEALGAIQAGLRGEQDPLERFGVGLSAAKVEARALADTGKDTAKALTDQEKQLARVEIILDQTNQTAGDFANTSDSLANQTRVLNAEFTDLKAAAGQQLIPILSDLAALLLDIEENAGRAKHALDEAADSFPGGRGLLDALSTNLFELPGKSKEQWDDLGRSIGVLPDKIGKLGTFRLVLDSMTTGATDAEAAVAGLGGEVEDLGQRWSAATIPLEGATGAFAEMQSQADRAAAAVEDTADAADDALDPFDALAAAIGAVGDAVDKAFENVRDDLDLEQLLDDITDQFGAVKEAADKVSEDGEAGTRKYRTEVRRLREMLLNLLEDLKNVKAQDKIELAAEIQRGSVDDLFRILGELSKGVVVPVSFDTAPTPGFSGANISIPQPGQQNAIPSFNLQGLNPAPVNNSQTTIIYPVGTTPTAVLVDQRLYQTRNGTNPR